MTPVLRLQDERVAGLGRAVRQAADRLAVQQREDGCWCALLTADTTLESDYVLLQLWLHPPSGAEWQPPTRPLIERAVESILARQLPDGGFNIYADGPADVSASVKAYFALKVAGVPAEDPRLERARECILSMGGIQAANSYVKVNLSLFDLYPREEVPTILPEVILMGDFIYEMSSWTRAIVVALAIVYAANPHARVPAGFDLAELFLPDVPLSLPRSEKLLSWRNGFLTMDRLFRWWEKYGSKAIRRKAVEGCASWMIQHFEGSDGLGAIYPSMMYAIMALDVLGYEKDHPLREEALRKFDNLMVRDGRHDIHGQTFFFQPCFSPIWDTAIATYALGETAAGGDSRRAAAAWMLSKEIRQRGDWSLKRPKAEPSGWAFEFNNEFYPDIDDTAMVLLALSRAQSGDREQQEAAESRGLNWLLAMQSKDGGWAAFDADNDWQFLSEVPFADHNAMLDPTCPDITGRVIEALCAQGLDGSHPAVRRGVDYLIRNQCPDGSWYGRWGVAYVYGACFALRGLRAAGESIEKPHIRRAADWIRSVQNADGGWGESCASYARGVFTAGESTPSQTAWALLGLMAAGDFSSQSLARGVEHLLGTQRADGGWDERPATGTGFPGVFYLNYHLYRLYFPLLALGQLQNMQSRIEHL